jgi:hypothetical protein
MCEIVIDSWAAALKYTRILEYIYVEMLKLKCMRATIKKKKYVGNQTRAGLQFWLPCTIDAARTDLVKHDFWVPQAGFACPRTPSAKPGKGSDDQYQFRKQTLTTTAGHLSRGPAVSKDVN